MRTGATVSSNKPLINLQSSLEVAGPSISVGFRQMLGCLGRSPWLVAGLGCEKLIPRGAKAEGVFTWVGLGGLRLQLRSYRELKIGSNIFFFCLACPFFLLLHLAPNCLGCFRG